jgi:hypothetical protein
MYSKCDKRANIIPRGPYSTVKTALAIMFAETQNVRMEETITAIWDWILLSFVITSPAEEQDDASHHLGNGGMHGSKCSISEMKQGKSKVKVWHEQKNKVK